MIRGAIRISVCLIAWLVNSRTKSHLMYANWLRAHSGGYVIKCWNRSIVQKSYTVISKIAVTRVDRFWMLTLFFSRSLSPSFSRVRFCAVLLATTSMKTFCSMWKRYWNESVVNDSVITKKKISFGQVQKHLLQNRFFFSWLFWCVLVLVYLTYCCSYCCFCGRYFEFVSRLNYFLTSFCVYYCPFATVYVSIYAPTAIFVDFFRHNRTVKFPFKFNCIKNKNPCTYNVESMP